MLALDRPITLARDFSRALDPTLLAIDCGIAPDAVQRQLLTSTSRKVIVNCCRQWGKSTTTAILALRIIIILTTQCRVLNHKAYPLTLSPF